MAGAHTEAVLKTWPSTDYFKYWSELGIADR